MKYILCYINRHKWYVSVPESLRYTEDGNLEVSLVERCKHCQVARVG